MGHMIVLLTILTLVCGVHVTCTESVNVSVNVSVSVDLDSVVNVVDDRYLSVTLEASIFKKHWSTFNIR